MKYCLMPLSCALLLAGTSVAYAAEPAAAPAKQNANQPVNAQGNSAGKATFKEFTVTKKTDAAQIATESGTAGSGGAVSNPTTSMAASQGPVAGISGGAVAGKVNMQDMNVTKNAKAAVPSAPRDPDEDADAAPAQPAAQEVKP